MKKLTALTAKKKSKIPIVMITAYSYPFAKIINEIGEIDAVLVGDSLGNVEYGYDTTLPVTLEQMKTHVSIVSKHCTKKPIIADMPFLSYGVSSEETVRNCGAMLKECGAHAVKMEGGKELSHVISLLVSLGIPVQGHIGLHPQHIKVLGGYKITGKTKQEENMLLEDALALEQAGVNSLILECVTEEAAHRITEELTIPTIGIGSGKYCDGQIVVINDILGLSSYLPAYVENYCNLSKIAEEAIKKYAEDVVSKNFPKKSFSQGLYNDNNK